MNFSKLPKIYNYADFTSESVINCQLHFLGRFLAYFLASYAANASSASLANTLSPLVREVGIDIMSSAFIVLNLFIVV